MNGLRRLGWYFGLLAGALSLLVCTRAAAEASADAAGTQTAVPDGGQRNFGFGVQGGLFQATGAGVHLGVPAVALEASAGVGPVLVVYIDDQDPNDFERDVEYRFFAPLQFDGDLLVYLGTAGRLTPMGMRAGYRYNALLGHGFALGGYAQRALSRSFGLAAAYGLILFPDASDRVLDHADVPDTADVSVLTSLQIGLTVAILIFP
jgi:hypothetical protein